MWYNQMKFVGLLSGGKDSVYNIVECVANGHELVCVANLFPAPKEEGNEGKGIETDSFMYQTVGVEIAPMIA